VDEKIRRSRKQEKDGAKRYGGKVNSRSGAGDIRKNDMRTETESVEFKYTQGLGYRLTAAELVLAWEHATIDSRSVIFGIEFQCPLPRITPPGAPRRWVVMPEDDYLGMRSDLESLRETIRCGDIPFET
jgi:hypothetical protein